MTLNKKKIADLRELEKETGEEILISLTILFKRDVPELVGTLKELIGAHEYLEAGRVAHRIKTSCANIGITDGYVIGLELETQCKKINPEFNYVMHVSRLEQIIVKGTEELEKELQTAA